MKNNFKQKPRERDSVDRAISDAMRYASATKVYVPKDLRDFPKKLKNCNTNK